jgi:uncharacterized iron-regulated membrane protein
MAAGLFLLVVSLTGIVLNYKRPILQALGLESSPSKKEDQALSSPAGPRTAHTLTDLPVGFARALAIAQSELGPAPIERFELKHDREDWLYKIKRKGGAELWISATTGAHFLKGEYEKVQRVAAGTPVSTFDWGKLLLDLHTGKIGGAWGQALMTGVAVLLFGLTLSGAYMYVKPILIRRARVQADAKTLPQIAPRPQRSSAGAPIQA